MTSETRYLIRGATVIDGTGAPGRLLDIEVIGGFITGLVEPGKRAWQASGSDINAQGRVVCPGFIDAHTHDDLLVLEPVFPHPKLSQGVCTVVTGNCGISLAPLLSVSPPAPLDILGTTGFRFNQFADYLAAIDEQMPCLNVVPLVGHTSLRVKHIADWSQPASNAEIEAMTADLSKALGAGAFGLSTGVYYPPAQAATRQELIDVCVPLRQRADNGQQPLLAMHLRDESDAIEDAMKEAFFVAIQSRAKLVLSHHKVLGIKNHGRTVNTLALVDAAAKEQSVCLDCYPYEASSTMLDAQKALLASDVIITWSATFPELSGKHLDQIANDWDIGIFDAANRLMPGGAIYFAMSPDDVDRVLSHPLTMIGSDGLAHDKKPHPRLWGAFPRVLKHYSRQRGLFSLEAAIHKMTGLPAQRFGLNGRGKVALGYAADLVIFNPETVGDTASYEVPTSISQGIEVVIVNGNVVMRDGHYYDVHSGQRLKPSWVIGH
jgi:N-acyl-D-amino-acid deacylase